MDLYLTNTFSGKRERFEPIQPGIARMYHCGPTVKEPINIHKFRSYLLADTLRRYFEFCGLEVVQVMNITDVGHLNEFEEDAVEIAAGRSGKLPWELVEEEEKEFHEQRRKLRILDAHHYPRARENVPEMLAMVEKLLASGLAYRGEKNVYFDVKKYGKFGQLSGKSLADLEKLQGEMPGRPNPEKRHPLDIDLWRTDVLHQMHWQSPWGLGFPGWHIECVVMGRKYLGVTFDIHTGSEEIIYPHHECEIAEAEAAEGKPLARFWLHSAHVLVEGKPISRSNRNLITVKGLLESDVSGAEIRATLLDARYREPLEFSPEVLDRAQGSLKRLRAAARKLKEQSAQAAPAGAALEEANRRLRDADAAFRGAMDDDLDFPGALAAALAMAEDFAGGAVPAAPAAWEALRRFDGVLGLLD